MVKVGAGDSRVVQPEIISFSSFSVFGLLIYLSIKIHIYRNMIYKCDYYELDMRRKKEENEYKNWLYEKSGGSVLFCAIMVAFFSMVTCGMFNSVAFMISYTLFVGLVCLKFILYRYFKNHFHWD